MDGPAHLFSFVSHLEKKVFTYREPPKSHPGVFPGQVSPKSHPAFFFFRVKCLPNSRTSKESPSSFSGSSACLIPQPPKSHPAVFPDQVFASFSNLQRVEKVKSFFHLFTFFHLVT